MSLKRKAPKVVRHRQIAHCMHWALEVEFSQGSRFRDAIQRHGLACNMVDDGKSGILLFTEQNMLESQVVDHSYFNHISRLFHIPYSCADPSWLVYHPALRRLIFGDTSAVFRIQGFPKSIEKHVAEALIDEDEDGTVRGIHPSRIHPSKHTHVLQFVYATDAGPYFLFGIQTLEDRERYKMETHHLQQICQIGKARIRAEPVSRAFFKMKEVCELLESELPSVDASFNAIDIGASPGGWTQYLSRVCNNVLAVDPGELDEAVKSLPNVTHIQNVIQSEEATDAISAFGQLDLCVCDMNTLPLDTMKIFKEYVLPALRVQPFQHDIIAVITLKMHKAPTPARIEYSFQEAQRMLTHEGCHSFKMLFLHANSRNERTLVCKIGPQR